MTFRARGRRSVGTFIPALLVVFAMWPIAAPVAGAGDTFQFWYAGHLVVTGRSPYDQSAWGAAGVSYGSAANNVADTCADPNASACAWVYPPVTAWLFAPFGLLSPPAGLMAVDLFVLITLIAGVVAVVFVFGPREPLARSVLLAAAAAAHPSAVNIRAGHFVGLLLLGLAALAYGLREWRMWPVVAGALALAVKPHIALAVAVAVPAVVAARGAWRVVASIAAALTVFMGAALLRSPEAVGALLTRSGGKRDLAWTTTWAMAGTTSAPGITLLAIALIAFGTAAVAIRWSPAGRRDPTIIAAAGSLSLVVTPYAQPYDFLLVYPTFAVAAAAISEHRRPARIVMLTVIALILIVGTWTPVLAEQYAWSYALLPVMALALLGTASVETLRCPPPRLLLPSRTE